jgi:cyanate lyase
MQVTVRVNQQACIAKGIDAPHSTTRIEVPVDQLTADQRAVLAALFKDGNITGLALDTYQDVASDGGLPVTSDFPMLEVAGLTLADLAAALDQHLDRWKQKRTAVAAEKAEKEVKGAADRQQERDYLAQPASTFARQCDGRQMVDADGDMVTSTDMASGRKCSVDKPWMGSFGGNTFYENHSLRTAKKEEVRILCRERNLPLYREAIRLEDEANAAKQATNKARKTQLEAVLKQHGTKIQQERYAAGFLNLEDEALPLLGTATFRPLDDADPTDPTICRFQSITAAEVREQLPEDFCGFDAVEVEFDSAVDAEIVTDDEWKVMQRIRELLPGSEVMVRIHHGYVNWRAPGHAADLYRNAVRVTMKVGEITMHRSYASPKGDYTE